VCKLHSTSTTGLRNDMNQQLLSLFTVAICRADQCNLLPHIFRLPRMDLPRETRHPRVVQA
jgi:hypothetical protein